MFVKEDFADLTICELIQNLWGYEYNDKTTKGLSIGFGYGIIRLGMRNF